MAKKDSNEGSKGIAIRPCTCTSDYQDKKYGKGKRVMNPKAKNSGHRCSVCAKEYL
jgi:hypothetical protein